MAGYWSRSLFPSILTSHLVNKPYCTYNLLSIVQGECQKGKEETAIGILSNLRTIQPRAIALFRTVIFPFDLFLLIFQISSQDN